MIFNQVNTTVNDQVNEEIDKKEDSNAVEEMIGPPGNQLPLAGTKPGSGF